MSSNSNQPDFCNWLRARDKSELTVSGYERDLRLFANWFRATNREEPEPQAITPLDVRQYKMYLVHDAKQKPASINRALAALRMWLSWAQDLGQIEMNPAKEIRGIKVTDYGPRWLSRRATYALLRQLQKAEQVAAARAAGNAAHPALIQAKRDAAVVALLLHAGLRVGELVALLVDDIEIAERSGQVTVRYGKGGRERIVPLNLDARRAVKAWLDVRNKDEERLFYGKQGKPLTARGVEHLVAKYGKRASLEDVTPHSLRHSFGKMLVDTGTPLDRVAKLMGHESLDTTKIYTMPNTDDLAQEVERMAWSED